MITAEGVFAQAQPGTVSRITQRPDTWSLQCFRKVLLPPRHTTM